MPNERYEIRLTQWDKNWKEETVVLYKGRMKSQMLELMRGLRNKQSDTAIVMYLFDIETGAQSDEYRF